MRRATLVPFAVGALIAAPTTEAATPGVVGHTVAGSAAKAKRIEQYWTPKRMRHAKPLPLGKPSASPSLSSPSAGQPQGKPRAIPPSPPKSSSQDTGKRAVIINNPSVYPYSTQGKLFGTDARGNFECSATVVSTPSRRVIFSAGHCARYRGLDASNEVFVPGYKNGHAPYGKFAAWRWYVPSQWHNNENFSYDISAMVLYQKVANVVGRRGIVWNYPANRHYVSYGYPAAPPFNGENLYSCPSSLGGRDPTTSSPQTMWITCNMTEGSSGGGWITRIGNQDGYLNSVNSYFYRNQPNRMYGPYFGNAARGLWNRVKYLAP
jgi:V8-like Glu-specific endopeptidase